MGKYYTKAHRCAYTHSHPSIEILMTLLTLDKVVQRNIKHGVVIWYLDCDTVTWYHNNTNIYIYINILICFYKSSLFFFFIWALYSPQSPREPFKLMKFNTIKELFISLRSPQRTKPSCFMKKTHSSDFFYLSFIDTT